MEIEIEIGRFLIRYKRWNNQTESITVEETIPSGIEGKFQVTKMEDGHKSSDWDMLEELFEKAKERRIFEKEIEQVLRDSKYGKVLRGNIG